MQRIRLTSRKAMGWALTALALTIAASLSAADEKDKAPKPAAAAATKDKDAGEGWEQIFDGKSMKGWKPAGFAGTGEVKVEDGRVVLSMGNDMTGIVYTNEPPKVNYEISFETMRVEGSDFFCGLTFPVDKSPCTLVLGGWGGGVVGLSSIDGNDASQNETSSYRSFKSGQWYRVRLVVTDKKIQAWIDENRVVDFDIREHTLGIRIECEMCRPLGVATWRTTGALRDIKWRKLK